MTCLLMVPPDRIHAMFNGHSDQANQVASNQIRAAILGRGKRRQKKMARPETPKQTNK